MFYIIGIGLHLNQMTLEAKAAIDTCDHIYIDNYTNILCQGDIQNLERVLNKKVILLNREELEQKQEFIKNNSCLLVIGNALSATTHYSIIQDAKQKNINTKVIPGISIFSYKGIAGLYEYKFGRTISVVYPMPNYNPTSFYNTIIDNQKIKAHTMCLLDIKVNENRFMSIKDGCEILNKIDSNNYLENKTCIAFGGMGSEDQEIKTFIFKNFNKINLKQSPQTLIICGELNEFENVAINEYR